MFIPQRFLLSCTFSGQYLPTDVKFDNSVPMPEVPPSHEVTKMPAPHSSTLEELASVSLMASGLTATTMVETGQ